MTDDSKTETPDPPPPDNPEEIRRERDEYYDLLLRKTAELDNYRKRTERQRADLERAAASDLLTDLLPLLDDLERALGIDVAESDASAYREGVTLIHRAFLEILEKRGVEPVEVVGTDFDPHVHEAVATETSDAYRDGEIIEEIRRGYTLRGRLLRPAMVKVAKT